MRAQSLVRAVLAALAAACVFAAAPDAAIKVDQAGYPRGEGKYYIGVPRFGRSWDFQIASNAFARLFYLAMRSFHGRRCGIAVDFGREFPGFEHAACHLQGAYHPSSNYGGPPARPEK